MKSIWKWLPLILYYQVAYAQNIGIGTSTPVANLMISTNSGFANPQLWLRQTNTADFARIRMQAGTGRYWDIAATIGANQVGDKFNFYHSVIGDLITLSGDGFVGIRNFNPIAPVTFAAAIGRKMVVYPGASGNVGLGVYNNEFRIHTDYAPADITMGYEDLQGNFTERFRFKGNGALLIGGNAGSAGQYLRSNGAGAAPSWASPAKETVSYFNQASNTSFGGTGLEFEVNGLNGTFFVSVPSTVVFGANMNIVSSNVLATSYGYAEVRVIEGISNLVATARSTGSMDPLRKTSLHPTGAIMLNPGTYTIKGYVGRLNVADLPNFSFAEAPGQIWVKVVPN